jgi:hypothetical protein
MASPSEVAAQRLAEAPAIEQEWNNMSYKDRAAWWMSAKWYGYMSKEAYCRGDAITNADESSRYGEPGFFIATRVPYFEVAAAPETPASAAPTASTAADATATTTTAVVEPPAPVSAPVQEPTAAAVAAATPAVSESVIAEAEPVLSALASAAAPTSHKKKKNKHGNKAAVATTGADKKDGGKTIQIKLGK